MALPINPFTGKPIDYTYLSPFEGASAEDPTGTERLAKQYRLQNQSQVMDTARGSYNPQDLEALRNRASGQDSTWLNLMLQKQAESEAQARDLAARTGKTSMQDAWSQLAMRGGVSGGERERLAGMSAQAQARSMQDVARQGTLDRLGLQAQEEQTRLDLMKQLPQEQLRKAGFFADIANQDIARQTDVDRFNTANALMQKTAVNANELEKYREQMRAWAAGKTADAQASAGKK